MRHTLSVEFGAERRRLAISLATEAWVPTLAAEAFTVHLPARDGRSAGGAAAVTVGPSDVATDVELRYDQPPRRAIVEARLAAAEGAHDVELRARVDDAAPAIAAGRTGAQLRAEVLW